MALIQADRVRETSSTTGSAGFTLVGAVDGFQRFSAAIGSANTCYYAATDGSAFEVGLGTVSANTLARTTVLDSSHASSGVLHRVDFQAGTKDVFATYAADKAVILDADGNLTVGTTANITTLGNVSVAKTLTITSGISGASTLNIKGAVSAGSTLGVKGNVSTEGTLSVIGAVSVGATLGITNDASVTGTFTFATATTSGNLNVDGNFTFATANSTGNLGVVKNVSVGGTFHVEGSSSAKGTFAFADAVTCASTLTVGGLFSAKSTSRFGGAAIFDDSVSVGGTFHIQGNASAQGTLNVKGAVSVADTVEGTVVSDTDGNLRDIPNSRTIATTTVSAAQTDTGNFIFLTSSDQTVVIPTAAGTFDTGDIFSVVCAGASATISSNITSMFKVGEAASTATIILGANKIASVLFVSSSHAYVTGT